MQSENTVQKEIQQEVHPYADILDLPRPISKKYRQMPIADRAAQFSPFSALTGHQELIRETQRIYEEKFEKTRLHVAEESGIIE